MRAASRIIADQAARLADVLDAMTGLPHTGYEMMLVAGALTGSTKHAITSTAARLVAGGWQPASADEYRAAVATRGPITDDDRRIVRSTATVGEVFTCYGGMSDDVTYEKGPDPRILSFGRHGDVPPDEQDTSDVGGQDPVSV
jgi:hypothetical protein